MSEENKAMVHRVVDEVINEGNMGVLDELCAPELAEEMKQMNRLLPLGLSRLA